MKFDTALGTETMHDDFHARYRAALAAEAIDGPEKAEEYLAALQADVETAEAALAAEPARMPNKTDWKFLAVALGAFAVVVLAIAAIFTYLLGGFGSGRYRK